MAKYQTIYLQERGHRHNDCVHNKGTERNVLARMHAAQGFKGGNHNTDCESLRNPHIWNNWIQQAQGASAQER